MKLYLSSYGLGNQPEQLQALVGPNKRAAVMLNAQDLTAPEKRAMRLDIEMQNLAGLGFQPEELDLRDYFGRSDELQAQLAQYGLLWIRGGNVFVLQRAMRQSGFDQHIGRLVMSEKLAYAGFSAGSCAAAPTLHGIELVDDATTVPKGYDEQIVWEGLNFVPYSIAPHYRSEHAESEAIDDVVRYFEVQGMPYKTLRDGQAIVINGDHEAIVG